MNVANSYLSEHYGDILSPNTSWHEVIVCHQVNCRGVMGAGLAKQIRNLFPMLFAEYQNQCARSSPEELIGKTFYYEVNNHGYNYTIANIYGQVNYGHGKRFTDYDALRKAFQQIRTVTNTYLGLRPVTRIRIPYKMGCGLGGGDWNIVLQIIHEELIEHHIHVEIWRLS